MSIMIWKQTHLVANGCGFIDKPNKARRNDWNIDDDDVLLKKIFYLCPREQTERERERELEKIR